MADPEDKPGPFGLVFLDDVISPEVSNLSRSAQRVLLYLWVVGKKGTDESFWRQRYMARDLGLSRETVNRAMKELEVADLLVRFTNRNGHLAYRTLRPHSVREKGASNDEEDVTELSQGV